MCALPRLPLSMIVRDYTDYVESVSCRVQPTRLLCLRVDGANVRMCLFFPSHASRKGAGLTIPMASYSTVAAITSSSRPYLTKVFVVATSTPSCG